MNRLGNALEQPIPALAVSFAEPMLEDEIDVIARSIDVAEFRADLFGSPDEKNLKREIRKFSILPILLTVRHQDEGGRWSGNEVERLGLIKKLISFSDGVDIELNSEIASDVIGTAHSMGKIAIASFHNFEITPDVDELQSQMDKSKHLGADFMKVATLAKNNGDFQKLVEFTLSNQSSRPIVMAMGDYGPISRIVLPMLGGPMVYACLNGPVAPGQVNYKQMHELSMLNPLYAREQESYLGSNQG